jgi:hypothetical protein
MACAGSFPIPRASNAASESPVEGASQSISTDDGMQTMVVAGSTEMQTFPWAEEPGLNVTLEGRVNL